MSCLFSLGLRVCALRAVNEDYVDANTDRFLSRNTLLLEQPLRRRHRYHRQRSAYIKQVKVSSTITKKLKFVHCKAHHAPPSPFTQRHRRRNSRVSVTHATPHTDRGQLLGERCQRRVPKMRTLLLLLLRELRHHHHLADGPPALGYSLAIRSFSPPPLALSLPKGDGRVFVLGPCLGLRVKRPSSGGTERSSPRVFRVGGREGVRSPCSTRRRQKKWLTS